MSAKELFPDTEPTLYDVIDAMQFGLLRVDERFELLEKKMDTGFEEVKQELRGIKQRLFKVELKLEDKSDTVLSHEERLISLEKWRKGIAKGGLASA